MDATETKIPFRPSALRAPKDQIRGTVWKYLDLSNHMPEAAALWALHHLISQKDIPDITLYEACHLVESVAWVLKKECTSADPTFAAGVKALAEEHRATR